MSPFAALCKRLEPALLRHLTEHADELREALETAIAERDDALQRASWAEDNAEVWRRDAIDSIQASGDDVGITIEGRIVGVPKNAEETPRGWSESPAN